MHQDRFRTGPPNKAYSEGHERIFGKRLERCKETKEEEERRERNRKAQHAQEAADGKKDAQYYIDNEQRVSSNPDFKPRNMGPSKEYEDGWERIYGKK
jgi:hypothetical protein